MVTPETPESPVTVMFSIGPTAATWAAAALLRGAAEWRRNGRRIPSQVDDLARLLNAIRVMEGQGGSPLDVLSQVGQSRDMTTAAAELEPEALSYADSAARLSVSLSTVKRLAATGALPVVRVGKSPRIRVADITAYLSADHCAEGTVTSPKASSKSPTSSLPEGA